MCHLFNASNVKDDEFESVLETVVTFAEDSHFSHRLMRCRDCGQPYLKEFYETVDWVGGDDAQRTTLVPVADAMAGKRLHDAFPHGLGAVVPRLVIDFPTGGRKTIGWVGLVGASDPPTAGKNETADQAAEDVVCWLNGQTPA